MVTKRAVFISLSIAALAAACGEDGGDPVIPPDPKKQVTLSASKDNTLYEDSAGTWSNGAGNFIFVGVTTPSGGSGEPAEKRRAVIAFNVRGPVPAGSTIDSVFLALNMNRTPTGARPVTLHRLVKDWGEGTSNPLNPNEGGGDASDPGDATWIHTFYDTALWTSPGGDCDAAVSASRMVGLNGTYTWGSTAAMVTDVQSWLDTPSGNFGWIVIGDESQTTTAKRFASRTHPTASGRPTLIVHYTEP